MMRQSDTAERARSLTYSSSRSLSASPRSRRHRPVQLVDPQDQAQGTAGARRRAR